MADPFIISEGSGVLIRDVDGKESVDRLSGLGGQRRPFQDSRHRQTGGGAAGETGLCAAFARDEPGGAPAGRTAGRGYAPRHEDFQVCQRRFRGQRGRRLKLGPPIPHPDGKPPQVQSHLPLRSYRGATAGALSAAGSWGPSKSEFSNPSCPGSSTSTRLTASGAPSTTCTGNAGSRVRSSSKPPSWRKTPTRLRRW